LAEKKMEIMPYAGFWPFPDWEGNNNFRLKADSPSYIYPVK
jgi:hypothetical protein